MTAMTVHHTFTASREARATGIDRALLRAASTLDSFVVARIERRSGAEHRRAASAQAAALRARRDAEARGAMGLLPR
ncbi:MAG TPA: hypothetical protein VN241_14495 [Microbacterium sp.]|nr:hypothetical protein [Microbacterium sp.]